MTTSPEPTTLALVRGQRLPDFFIAGHHKCGTTALYAMLASHPQIYLPRLKEPRFFATDLRYSSPTQPKLVPETLEEYLALFEQARADQRAGDGSPMYLWSREAAANIAAVQPDARVVAILREPASFLHSLHNHWLLHHVETEKDLRAALALEPLRREGRAGVRLSYWPQAQLYSDHVRYVEQLRRYRAVFPEEQLLVLIYDDFRADNEATVRRVLRFLELDDSVPIEAMERMTTKSRVRARRLDGAIRALYAADRPWSRAAKTSITALTSEHARHKAAVVLRRRVVYAKPRELDEALMLELRRRFKGEVEALSDYLDRDLVALWGYDKLG
jgi:hypothetical protein